jgi:hypothetical protein
MKFLWLAAAAAADWSVAVDVMGAYLCPALAAPRALSAAVVRRAWLWRQESAVLRLVFAPLGKCSLAYDCNRPCGFTHNILYVNPMCVCPLLSPSTRAQWTSRHETGCDCSCADGDVLAGIFCPATPHTTLAWARTASNLDHTTFASRTA